MIIVQDFNFLCAINNKIFFQWVPSHVNVCDNETANELAREGSLKDANCDGYLTFSKTAFRVEENINALGRVAPVHQWYACNRPRAALIKGNSGCIQMAYARFRSGHIHVQGHVLGISLSSLPKMQYNSRCA